MPLPPLGLVFDLDGTLIESRRDIATAVNRMRAGRGLAPLSVEEVRTMVGEGARALVRRALPPATPREELAAAVSSYLAHYREVCLETTRPYPGVPGMLAEVAQGFALAVLSNKGESLSRHILAGLGLDRYLRQVVGGDTLPTRKPDPGGLFLLADRLAIAPARLLLVGDSRIDALTARAAGSPFALALWGWPDGGSQPPAAAEPEIEASWRFAQPADLPAALGGEPGP
ncbi:MAG TPA: HAD-IA family hydrolase [Thermoanaerobaculia bacterium]|nr:HAD-IA family hydrolase [Thermoanaerobaculia bacterium]